MLIVLCLTKTKASTNGQNQCWRAGARSQDLGLLEGGGKRNLSKQVPGAGSRSCAFIEVARAEAQKLRKTDP